MARIPGVGDTLGPYRITRELGAGGMGVVFEAVEEGLGRRVALKVLALQLAEEPEFRARFTREATVLARSDSPHIIQVYSHGEHEGCLYLATQFVPGGDLAARVAAEGLPSPDVALDVTAQVASALADAHAVGVIHRDVKPHNVLLRPGQGQVHAYLCDFGIARDDESSLTSSGIVAGTYAYLAPERFRGEPATPASDVYALGCLLWFLLAGRAPYDGGIVQLAHEHQHSAIPQLPGASEQVNAFLRRAMAKDPAARHPSAADAAAQLRAIRASGNLPTQQLASPPPPPAPPTHSVPQATPPLPPDPVPLPWTSEPVSRRPVWPAVVAVVLVTVLGIGGVLGWQLLRDDGDEGDGRSEAADPGVPGTGDAPRGDDSPVAAADVDGDGRDDTILVDRPGDRVLVLPSDPEADHGFLSRAQWSGSSYDEARVVRGDFTGDALADLALVEPGRVRVARSTGATFGEPETWSDPTLPEDFLVTVGDYDGDGRDDLAFATDADGAVVVEVALSQADGLAQRSAWGRLDGRSLTDVKLGAGDLDADGSADLVAMVQPASGGTGVQFQALLSEGGGFGAAQSWLEEPAWDWAGTRPGLGDIDADGDADVLALRDVGHVQLVVLRSVDGALESDPQATEVTDLAFDRTRSVVADTNGDGAAEVVLGDRDNDEVRLLGVDDDQDADVPLSLVARTRAPVGAEGSIFVGISR